MSSLSKSSKKKNKRDARRVKRVRFKYESFGIMPRVSVSRSLNQIYAQIIDDSTHSTIVSFSSVVLTDKKGNKKDRAKRVGLELGKLALEKKLEKVFFDRGKYIFHGRVAALAEGLRESGIKF